MGCQDNEISLNGLGRFNNDADGVSPKYISTCIVSLAQKFAKALLDEFLSIPGGYFQ